MENIKTGLEFYPISKLIKLLDSINDCTKTFLKTEKLLKKMPDSYDRDVYQQTYALAERFQESYKDSKWKIKDRKVDNFVIGNLRSLGKVADEYNMRLGKEKNSYHDYEFFKPWEEIYSLTRQYCVDLSILEDFAIELENRFYLKGKPIKHSKKEPNILVKGVQWLIKTAAGAFSVSKGF